MSLMHMAPHACGQTAWSALRRVPWSRARVDSTGNLIPLAVHAGAITLVPLLWWMNLADEFMYVLSTPYTIT